MAPSGSVVPLAMFICQQPNTKDTAGQSTKSCAESGDGRHKRDYPKAMKTNCPLIETAQGLASRKLGHRFLEKLLHRNKSYAMSTFLDGANRLADRKVFKFREGC